MKRLSWSGRMPTATSHLIAARCRGRKSHNCNSSTSTNACLKSTACPGSVCFICENFRGYEAEFANVTHSFDVLILGGGAAGLMCAIEAGKRGRSVAILERAERLGKKILISGGGRCNFTNLNCEPRNFLSSNPHFAKSALARYT